MITKNSVIEFYDLKFSKDRDEHDLFGLVRWDTDDCLKIDKDVMALIKFLQRGKKVREVSEIINFSPDVLLSILRMLDSNHFIKKIDYILIPDKGTKIKPWLRNIDRKWLEWMVSKSVITSVIIFSFTGMFLGFIIYGIPTYKSYFWTTDLFDVYISLFFVEIILTFTHEFAHFIVTKAVGGQAVVHLSYRYIYIVAETESYHLGVLPKNKRYLVYFAGVLSDCFLIGILYWIIIGSNLLHSNFILLDSFFIAVILSVITGIIWQFDVFLETDMYNFLTEYLNIEFIRNDAIKYMDQHTEKWTKIVFLPVKKLLKYFAKNYVEDSDDMRLLSRNDKKKVKVFIFFLVGGLLGTTIIYIFYSIPRDITYVFQGIATISREYHHLGLIGLGKLFILIGLILFEYSLTVILWFRHKKRVSLKR